MITDDQIKELLVSHAIMWNKEESQDRAFIYVDDFVKELQAKLKLLGIGSVVGRSEQLVCDLYDDLGCAISGKNNENCVRCKYSRKAN